MPNGLNRKEIYAKLLSRVAFEPNSLTEERQPGLPGPADQSVEILDSKDVHTTANDVVPQAEAAGPIYALLAEGDRRELYQGHLADYAIDLHPAMEAMADGDQIDIVPMPAYPNGTAIKRISILVPSQPIKHGPFTAIDIKAKLAKQAEEADLIESLHLSRSEQGDIDEGKGNVVKPLEHLKPAIKPAEQPKAPATIKPVEPANDTKGAAESLEYVPPAPGMHPQASYASLEQSAASKALEGIAEAKTE